MEYGLGSAILITKSLVEMVMAWIKMIKEDEAEGELKSTYDKWSNRGVDNIMKIHSLTVPSLKAHNLIYGTLMRGKSDLSRVQREMIAVVASVANHCIYWIQHHGWGLRRLTRNPELVRQLKLHFSQAELSPSDRAMCEYVEKLTLKPWEMVEADVVALRDAGFPDFAILDINQVTGYYA
jgi:uncharacterized peroxidase-related enzyme